MVLAGAGAGASTAWYLAGSALTRSRQRAAQTYHRRPACTAVCLALLGSTFTPHTGSRARSGAGGAVCDPARGLSPAASAFLALACWASAFWASAFMLDLLARWPGAAVFGLTIYTLWGYLA